MADQKARRGLGRGLSALMADVNLSGSDISAQPTQFQKMLPIDTICPNPDQPRRSFATDQLEELAASIREKGVLQPLIVRLFPGKEDTFQIVAGERRWRAAQVAHLNEIPVIVRDLDDRDVMEISIIENIQRADLNPLEEAVSYRQLMDRFGHTQERLSEVLGKSRSHIANLLRLLKLPHGVQALVRNGSLSAGHARALIPAQNPGDLARHVVSRGLSVRQTENLVKKENRPISKRHHEHRKDADTRALERDLSESLRFPVTIVHGPEGKGTLKIQYASLESLDLLCARLTAPLRDD